MLLEDFQQLSHTLLSCPVPRREDLLTCVHLAEGTVTICGIGYVPAHLDICKKSTADFNNRSCFFLL